MSDNVREQLSGKRQPLAEVIPTKLPISINLEVAAMCNLRCEFCYHSNDESKGRHYGKDDFISMELVDKLVKDIQREGEVKQILLCGLGEPLLHREIADIVRKLKTAAGRVGIITNGTLLTKELACELLDAGLDAFRVSLDGLTDEDFLRFTGRNIDVDRMYENIRFLKEESDRRKSEGGKGCLVYVKTLDYMVEEEARKQAFYERWQRVADCIHIEGLIKPFVDVKVCDNVAEIDSEKPRFGGERIMANICPRPFYDAVITKNGDVHLCCSSISIEREDIIFGNIMESSLAEVWNNKRFTEVRRQLLRQRDVPTLCSRCVVWRAQAAPEDLLDDAAEEIIKRYDRLLRDMTDC